MSNTRHNHDRLLDAAHLVAKTYARDFRFEVAVLDGPGQGRRVLAYWLECRPGEGWVLPAVTYRVFDVLDALGADRAQELARWLEEAAGAGPAAPVTWRGARCEVLDDTGTGASVFEVKRLRDAGCSVTWSGIGLGQVGKPPIEWPSMAPIVDLSPEVARGVACALRQIYRGINIIKAEVLEGAGTPADLVRGVVDPDFGRLADVDAGLVTIACAACGHVHKRRARRQREGLLLRIDLSCSMCKYLAEVKTRVRAADARQRARINAAAAQRLAGVRARCRRGAA